MMGSLALAISFVLWFALLSTSSSSTDADNTVEHTHANDVTEEAFVRADFASAEQIKERFTQLEPGADSVEVSVLNNKIELYSLFSNGERMGRYVAIIENTACTACDDLHFLVKISDRFQMTDFIFLLPVDERTQSEVRTRFMNNSISEKFGFNHMLDDPKWSYAFFKGLRNASAALQKEKI